MNRDDLRKAMGTLPAIDTKLNSTIKFEQSSVETSIVDYNSNPYKTMFSGATATWGDNEYKDKWKLVERIDKLRVIVAALTGRTLPQALEPVMFMWRVKGLPRATFNKHTEVAKLGCTFFSVGCRDNNKLDTDFIIPDKKSTHVQNAAQESIDGLKEYFQRSKEVYKLMLDAEGGSWQSARAFLPLCYQHCYHFAQNLLSLVRMYPRMKMDEDLHILYDSFVKSIEDEDLNLIAYAIEKNKELREQTDINYIYFDILSNRERRLLNA